MTKQYLIYEVTPRCNYNCLYCYNVWKADDKYPPGELAIKEIKHLFNKVLVDIHLEWIILSGGEPLLHKNINEIIKFLKEKNQRIGIATNGSLLKIDNVHKLIEDGIGYFEISLNSTNVDNYKRLCRSDSLKKVKNAILLVKKKKIPLTVSFTVTRINLNDIEKVIDLCYAFSVDTIALNRFVPGGEGIENKEELTISKKDLESVLKIANEKSSKHKIPINITIPIEDCEIKHAQYPRLNFGTCGCGESKWVIDPVGNLRTCEQNPEILGNLLEKSFTELSQMKSVKDFRNNNINEKCHDCGYIKNCGGGCRFVDKLA
ncbi:radical SAM protein [Patescibacteria group bacterium]|nr:radical SAM protein [Patescibacteria group bacterium]